MWRPRQPGRASTLRWLERGLLAVAAASLGYFMYATAERMLYQAHEARRLETILATLEAAPASQDAVPEAAPPPAPGDTVGRVEIPRLGVSAVIRAGTDARTLQLAVGHIPGTARPGEPGNVGLAGHRDTFFRRLGRIESDDVILITTRSGVHRYRVERTNVVEPRDVWVLDPTDRPSVTLVTCYPFSYIGAAPQRFIVRAVAVDAADGDAAAQ